MLDLFDQLIRNEFMPHGYCYLWLPEVLWLHVVADSLIALAYFMIPIGLAAFVIKRRELPFPWIFLLFGAFITACGVTHVMSVWTVWNPHFGIEGLVKLGTAAISLATAFAMMPLMPRAVALPSPRQLADVNRQLRVEIAERRRVEHELRRIQAELRQGVEDRTVALTAANRRLRAEVKERRRAEQRMQFLAFHDPLTGLPNRALLQDRLDHTLAQAHRDGTRVAVMLLDLDHFKHINDTLGHPCGDLLLKEVAARLRGAIRASDTLARLGGDEFAVIQGGVKDADSAHVLACKLAECLAAPFDICGNEVHVATSVGITIFPEDGEAPEQLLANADMALYQAKAIGRSAVHFFAADMLESAHVRKRTEHDLRRAIERDELTLLYQPQINLRSGAMLGVEALLRWQRPGSGLVGPDSFIPVAETTGLIRGISQWVLREACRQGKRWQDAGMPLVVSVNLSPSDLRRRDLPAEVEAVLEETGLDPALLTIEITESLLLENGDVAAGQRRLTELGVGIAIDDFGTGYSSLSYLSRFAINRIKIDKTFVGGIGRNEESEAIVRAIVSLGQSLGKPITAEGVETVQQLAFLRAHACDDAQGFLISRPVPPAQITRLPQVWYPAAVAS